MDTFSYENANKEEVACNWCGRDDTRVIVTRAKDRSGVLTKLCRICGLVFISPRMTRSEYDRYYRDFYRDDRAAVKGQHEERLEENFEHARAFGTALARRLGTFIKPGVMLDVGSSTGGILFGLREAIPGLIVRGIEPSRAESSFANARGISTQMLLFEDFIQGTETIDNIICVQSLNHLLDPRAFFEWAYRVLPDDGALILAVKNFRQQSHRAGTLSSAVQIDHPYMFVPEVLIPFVESCGFSIVYTDIDETKSQAQRLAQKKEGMSAQHMRIVGKKDPAKRRAVKDISQPLVARKLAWQLSPASLALGRVRAYCARVLRG